jgi:hypothetical protein
VTHQGVVVAFSQDFKAYRSFGYINQVISKEKSVLLLKLIQIITIWVPWLFLEFLLDVGSPCVFFSCHIDVPDKV